MLAARGAPHFEPGQPAEGEQRLTDGAGGSMHEHALAWRHVGRTVQELVRRRPAQDERGRLRRVDARRHASQVVGPERAIRGVRPDHCHVGHAVANLKAAHAVAELINLADDVIAQHEGRLEAHRLGVEAAPDQHLGIVHARGEHADPDLAPAGRRQRSVNHLQPVGTAEAPDLNNRIARLTHGRVRASRIAEVYGLLVPNAGGVKQC